MKKILILFKDLVVLFIITLVFVIFIQELFNGNMQKQNFPIWGAIIIGIIFLAFFIGYILVVVDDIKVIKNERRIL